MAAILVLEAQGWHDRPLELGRAREIVLDPGTSSCVQDAVWAELVTRARDEGERWQLAAVWMMSPGLRKIVGRLCPRAGVEVGETEAEVVAGFLEELRCLDTERARIGSSLWWATFRRAWRVNSLGRREIPSEELALAVAAQAAQDHDVRPLIDAVHEGVLSVSEANLINRTRLEGERLGAIAERMGLRYHACRQRRARAEERLADYLLLLRDDTGSPDPLEGQTGRTPANRGVEGTAEGDAA